MPGLIGDPALVAMQHEALAIAEALHAKPNTALNSIADPRSPLSSMVRVTQLPPTLSLCAAA
jgi:hypothetical protein